MAAAVIDNSDAGFSNTGVDWTSATGTNMYGADFHYCAGSDGSEFATWSITGLTPGVPVYIGICWEPFSNRATNSPFTVLNSDGSTVSLSVAVNQQLSPSDFAHNGASFKTLGTVTPTGTTLTVKLTNLVSGAQFVIADAVWYDTNPPPTPFAGSDSHIVYSGLFGTPGATISPVGPSSEIRVGVTGTECILNITGNGTQYGYSIDGGAETLTSPGVGTNTITLFTGLSDTTHDVVIRCVTNLNVVHYTAMFTVTGSAPALVSPTGYTDTQYTIHSQSGFAHDNCVADTIDGGGFTVRGRGSARFLATPGSGGTMRVWCSGSGTSKLWLTVNKDISTHISATPAANYGWVTFTGLTPSVEQEFILGVDESSTAWAVMIPGGTFNTSALSNYGSIYFFGDSITASAFCGGDGEGYTTKLAIKLHKGWQILAGTGQSAYVFGQAHKADPGASTPSPGMVFIAFGVNDESSGLDIATQFRPAVDAIVDQILSDLPSATVIWPALFPTSSITLPDAYSNSIAASVATHASDRYKTVSVDSWSVIPDVGDHVHPTAAGNTTIANNLFADAGVNPPAVTSSTNPYSYSLSLYRDLSPMSL